MFDKKKLRIDELASGEFSDLSDFVISEEDKESEDYLIAMTDNVIQRNVDENSDYRKRMFKMRDFYDGIRDPEEYAYLEDNFGIGNPSEIKFTPLIRNRVDALIGLMSATEFDYKVSVVDRDSLFKAEQERSNLVYKELMDAVNQDMQNALQNQQQEEPATKLLTPIERLYQEAEEKSHRKWRNNFIQSAIDFIEDSRECPAINLRRIRELLFTDLAVVGQCNYRVQAKEIGKKPKPHALIPENCYYTLRRDMDNVNEASEFVYVRYMSKRDILQEYGHFMSEDVKVEVLEQDTVKLGSTLHYYQTLAEHKAESQDGTSDRKKKSAVDRYMLYGADQDVVRVYEVEWKANNPYDIDSESTLKNRLVAGPEKVQKQRWRQDLYRSLRIGETVYLDMGKDNSAVRYDHDPDKVYLTFNGAHYSDRGGEPYSIVWKAKDIQDMHDILLFHRDNLIASSGVRGVNLEYSSIPEFLGDDEMERVMKALAFIKQGLKISDNSMDGAEYGEGGNSRHGTYDMTINGESLNAINATIDQLDAEATRITGVTPQMLGAIEQREAVSNVKVGINQTSLVLKGMFDTHDRVMKSLLTDHINAAKQTIPKDGYHGSYQEGRKVFTIFPKYFSFTNYRMTVINSSQEKLKVDEAKTLIHEAMATGSVPIQVGLRVVMMDNPTEIIELASEIAEKHDLVRQELEQTKQQRDEMEKEIEKMRKELEKVDAEKLQLEKDKVMIQNKLADSKIQTDSGELQRKRIDDSVDAGLKERQLDLEEEQLHLSSNEQKQKVRRDIV